VLLAILTVALVAYAKVKVWRGNSGERCSTMCPKAEAAARAECEDESKTASIKSCDCDEKVQPPEATVIFSCQ
jgi:hypothetical protein